MLLVVYFLIFGAAETERRGSLYMAKAHVPSVRDFGCVWFIFNTNLASKTKSG